ncbi:MAG: copper-binding protein [Casimicrobium sp.]|jgi:Cu/Ag efflux protein CusF
MFALKSIAVTTAVIGFATTTQIAFSQTSASQSGAPVTQVANSSAATEMSSGEVRKLDKENKKVTLKHGPIKNLDMPSMTMVFQAKDASMLDKLVVGDKVKFNAENLAGSIVVTKLEITK